MKEGNRLFVITVFVVACCMVTIGSSAQSVRIIEKVAKGMSGNNLRVLVGANVVREFIKTDGFSNVPEVLNQKREDIVAKKTVVPPMIKPVMKKPFCKNISLMKGYVEKTKNRFLNYAKISSQSVDTADMEAFPITEGQIMMAEYLENELQDICKGSDAVIKRSADQYVRRQDETSSLWCMIIMMAAI